MTSRLRRTVRGPERAFRAERAALRAGEAAAIYQAGGRLARLETTQERRDADARMFTIAESRLQELERVDDYRHGGETPRAVADQYLVPFAGALAWRFKCRTSAIGAFEDAEGTVDAVAFSAARLEDLLAYLTSRFPLATPSAVKRAAERPRERGLNNFRLTAMMHVTRAEHDALGLSQLKWADAPEDQVKSELRILKNARDRQRRRDKARAAGKRTAAERSKDSIAELARLMGKSRRSIERWISLGALSAKIENVAVDAPHRYILGALSATIEARRRDGCAKGAPTAINIPPKPSADVTRADDPMSPPVSTLSLDVMARGGAR